jgi:hypothetical protein
MLPDPMTPRPLARFSLFESSDLDEARERVARVFCPHRLDMIGRGSFDACHNHVSGERLSLNFIQYGAKTLIAPGRTYRFLPAADPAVGWCCNQQRPGSLLLVPGKGRGVEPAPADHDDLGRGLPADPGQGGARSLAGSPVTAARLGRQQAADLLRTAGPDQRCRCRTLRPDHAPGDRGRQRAGDALLRRPAGPPA